MNISIINQPFTIQLYGFSGTATNKEYGKTGFVLMDAMWKEVRQHNLLHKGINYWVYYKDEAMFTGVELEDTPPASSPLQQRLVQLNKYAYYKHIGPYNLLKQAYAGMRNELHNRGIMPGLPGVEIYGHWTDDVTKLETEILMSIE
jgi:hypothetical protein